MSQYPDIAASDDLTVEMLRAMIPNFVVKGTSETRASTTTLADDTDLLFPVTAGEQYVIKFHICASAILAADIQTSWNVPAGTSGLKRILGPGSTATDASADNISMRCGVHNPGTAVTYSGVRNSNALAFTVLEEAVLTITTTGTVAFRWAQATSNATGSIVFSSSWAEYRRIA